MGDCVHYPTLRSFAFAMRNTQELLYIVLLLVPCMRTYVLAYN
jgi:hypothetical protein